MTSPNAPKTALIHIIKAFDGSEKLSADLGSLFVSFKSQEDKNSVIKLVNMLQGWKAVAHPSTHCMIQVFEN